MQIQISWLLQKPTDLDLHCLQRQGISGFSRTRVKYQFLRSAESQSLPFTEPITTAANKIEIFFFYLFSEEMRLDISCELSASRQIRWNVKPCLLWKILIKKKRLDCPLQLWLAYGFYGQSGAQQIGDKLCLYVYPLDDSNNQNKRRHKNQLLHHSEWHVLITFVSTSSDIRSRSRIFQKILFVIFAQKHTLCIFIGIASLRQF